MSENSSNLWISTQFERFFSLPGIKHIFKLFEFFFVEISPNIPRSAEQGITASQRKHAFLAGATSAWFFCLIVPIVWTLIIGRFSGEESDQMYFFNDIYNIITYLVICPLYVGFGAVLMATVLEGGADLKELEIKLGVPQAGKVKKVWTTALFFVCTISFTLSLTVNYIRDCLDFDRIGYVYWFADKQLDDVISLNSLGVYYFIYNFMLLLFTVWSFMAFMTSFTAVTRVARALTNVDATGRMTSNLRREEVEIKISTFSHAYLFAKLQVAVYILNFWVWEKSPLGQSGNIVIAHVFLVIIGWLCLSIPRHYLELQWNRYAQVFNSQGESPTQLRIQSSLSPPAQLALKLVDHFLIASVLTLPFLSNFLSYKS